MNRYAAVMNLWLIAANLYDRMVDLNVRAVNMDDANADVSRLTSASV